MSSSEAHFVYLLTDPLDDGRGFYVGVSRDPKRRKNSAYSAVTAERIKSIRTRKGRVGLVILEVVEQSEKHAREKFWIAQCRYRGMALTNINEGGTGVVTQPIERRERQSAALKGRPKGPFTEEHRANLQKAIKTYTADPEWRQKRADAQKKLWADPDYREKMRAKHKARWENPDYRQAQAAAQQAGRAAKKALE